LIKPQACWRYCSVKIEFIWRMDTNERRGGRHMETIRLRSRSGEWHSPFGSPVTMKEEWDDLLLPSSSPLPGKGPSLLGFFEQTLWSRYRMTWLLSDGGHLREQDNLLWSISLMSMFVRSIQRAYEAIRGWIMLRWCQSTSPYAPSSRRSCSTGAKACAVSASRTHFDSSSLRLFIFDDEAATILLQNQVDLAA